jgi:hypothetical protein
MADRLPPGIAGQLDTPEGTLTIVYNLPEPLSQPPNERVTLIADESPAKTTVRIDIDEQMRMHFVRQAPGGTPADVSVGLTPLRGVTSLYIFGAWSPTHMAIDVYENGNPQRHVRRSTGD